MGTKLPESRHRQLPPHLQEEAARRRQHPHLPPVQGESRGVNPLRSFVVMLLVGGMLFGGIWFYVHGSREDLKKREAILAQLQTLGADLWNSSGLSGAMMVEEGDARKDLADLPRVIGGVRTAAKQLSPRIQPVEGDPPPGRGNATHQIQYIFNNSPVLLIRLSYDAKTGGWTFIGVYNRIVPSREVLEEETRAATEAKEAAPPAAPASPPAAPAPAPEKVSEPPGNAP